ncbi:MAG: hypothetical protein WC554_15010 [Clostridia bacterium]
MKKLKPLVEIVLLGVIFSILLFGFERAIEISDDNYCSNYPSANYCKGVSLK